MQDHLHGIIFHFVYVWNGYHIVPASDRMQLDCTLCGGFQPCFKIAGCVGCCPVPDLKTAERNACKGISCNTCDTGSGECQDR